MFIANIAFAKPSLDPLKPEYKSFGAIWYDKDKHRASILLKGFRQGQFVAKPFNNVNDAPYLEGDIVYATGDYVSGTSEKEYMWCGWIWTCSDQRGHVYNGVLEISPFPVAIQRELKETDDLRGKKQGIFLNIMLTDKESA